MKVINLRKNQKSWAVLTIAFLSLLAVGCGSDKNGSGERPANGGGKSPISLPVYSRIQEAKVQSSPIEGTYTLTRFVCDDGSQTQKVIEANDGISRGYVALAFIIAGNSHSIRFKMNLPLPDGSTISCAYRVTKNIAVTKSDKGYLVKAVAGESIKFVLEDCDSRVKAEIQKVLDDEMAKNQNAAEDKSEGPGLELVQENNTDFAFILPASTTEVGTLDLKEFCRTGRPVFKLTKSL